MAQHIASQNSEIMGWIEYRKRSGHSVPTKVEIPSQQIAKAIQSMSELTFIVPYTDHCPGNSCEFEKILFDKLSDNSDVTLEKEYKSEHETVINNCQ
jgi:hypothetical protein